MSDPVGPHRPAVRHPATADQPGAADREQTAAGAPAPKSVAPTTVAIVAIGNELLSGKVRDENLSWLAGELRGLGVALRVALVVPDEPRAIADAVDWARARAQLVLTCGGVGPTHDDVTLEGLALAFDRPLERHPDLAARIEAHYQGRFDPQLLRMADLPRGTELLWPAPFVVPIYRLENVYAFPGVPEALRYLFQAFAERLRQPPYLLARLELDVDEGQVAPLLQRAQLAHAPAVEIGSYPRFDAGAPYRVLVTFEGKDRAAVAAAAEAVAADVASGLGPQAILRREGPSPPQPQSFVA